jgi:ABC-type branched-subunit amino acid transport system substrate-binding protein
MLRGRVCAIAVVVGIAAAGCGNSGEKSSSTTAGTTAPTEPGATTTTADLSANHPIDETGVSDSQIKFTSISTISNNPLGTDIGDAFNDGIEAYFEFRNDAGGLYGRDLVLAEQRDDQLGLNQQEAQAMVAEDDSLGAFVATLDPTFSGADVLNDAAIPTFGWNINTKFADRPNIFGHQGALCLGCSGKYVPYLAKQVGATKVGVLGYSVEASAKCVDGVVESFDEHGAEAGAEVVFSDNSLAFGLVGGIAPQVSEMKRKGVDFVSTCMDLNGMKATAEEFEKQGIGDVVMHHPNTYNQPFVAENAELFEGDVVIPQFVPFEYVAAGELREKFFEYTDETTRGELTMVGWIVADIAYTGLVKAGPDFDRAKVVAALNATTDYSAGGLTVPIDWTRQHNDPRRDPSALSDSTCFSPVRVHDGVFEQFLGTDETPWVCLENGTEGLGEAELKSFLPAG